MQPHADQKDRQYGQRGRGAGEHRDHCPPGQHRHLRREKLVGQIAQVAHLGLGAHEPLHQRDVSERVGSAFGEVRIMPLDRTLQRFGLVDDKAGQDREHDGHRDQHQSEHPIEVKRQRQQDEKRHRRREGLAEELEPSAPQRIGARQHDLHQPAGMGGVVKRHR